MGGEGRVDAHLVGAVAVEDERSGELEVLAVDDGERDPRSVRGDGPLPIGGVTGRVEVAEDRLLLEQGLLALVQRDLQHARRRDERHAPDAQRRRVGLGVGAQPGRSRALDGGDDPARGEQVAGEGVAVGERQTCTWVWASARSLRTERGAEGVDVLDPGARSVRHHLAPGARPCPPTRPSPPEGGSPGRPRCFSTTNQPVAARRRHEVVDGVLHPLTPGQDHPGLGQWGSPEKRGDG